MLSCQKFIYESFVSLTSPFSRTLGCILAFLIAVIWATEKAMHYSYKTLFLFLCIFYSSLMLTPYLSRYIPAAACSLSHARLRFHPCIVTPMQCNVTNVVIISKVKREDHFTGYLSLQASTVSHYVVLLLSLCTRVYLRCESVCVFCAVCIHAKKNSMITGLLS